jgi:hypothetical protein
MKKSKGLFFSAFILFLFVFSLIRGEDLAIVFNQTHYAKSYVDTDFSFSGAISYDTVEAIQNGITARLILTFQLAESGGVFGSVRDVLRERVESFNLTYDVWENSFKILDRNRNEEYLASNPSEVLMRIHDGINPVKLRASSVRKNEKLVVRAKIKIQTIKLYPPFGVFLFFFDPWNYESSWLYSNVISFSASG